MRETLGLNSETTLVRIREMVVFFRRKNHKEHLGHDIYDEGRKFEPYIEPKNVAKYKALFGEATWSMISSLNDALAAWSTKYYENAHDIKQGQYDMEGFRANLYAISSEITPLSNQLRENFSSSYSVGLSSYTLPSEVDLSMETSPLAESLLNAVSQISKYLTAIENASDTSNVTQEQSEVKKTGDTTTSYNKNVDYTYAQGSLLVPYTTEQILGRIKQDMQVEASHPHF